jgi:hypothetical protein
MSGSALQDFRIPHGGMEIEFACEFPEINDSYLVLLNKDT